MSLNLLDDGASVRPDLNMSVISSCVAPPFFVECKWGHAAQSSFAKCACLIKLLRDVCWMPELNCFSSKASKSQIFRPLGPRNINDLFLRSLSDDELLLSLKGINCDFVVIWQVSASNIPATWWNRYAGNSTRSLFELEGADLLLVFNWPNMDWGGLASLASHCQLSVSTYVERKNVVSVELTFIWAAFRPRFHLLTTVELLRASFLIENDTKGCSHVNDFSISWVAAILVAILSPVSVNVLDFPLLLRLFLVELYYSEIEFW